MGLVDTLARRLGYVNAKAFNVAIQSRYPQGMATATTYAAGSISFPGWDRIPGPTDEQRARTALQNEWVYIAITAIARELGLPNVIVQKQNASGDWDEVPNHEFTRMWQRPNRFMGASFLAQQWLMQRLLFGESYIFLAGSVGQKFSEMWPIPSMWMRPQKDPKDFITGYLYQTNPDDKPILIPPELVIYSRQPHPFVPTAGLSPLAALYNSVTTDTSQVNWNKNFFARKNAKLEQLISLPADLSDDDFTRAKQELFDFFGGENRQAMVTRAGAIDVKPLGVNQKDMDFLNGRIMTREAIFMGFGIPPGYFDKSANRANAEAAKASIVGNVIWPTLASWAEDLTAQLMPYWYGDNFRCTFEDIRPRDRLLEIRELQGRRSMWTLNELRTDAGMKPLDDPPEYPGAWDKVPAIAGIDAYAMSAAAFIQQKNAPKNPDGTPAAAGGKGPLLIRPNPNEGLNTQGQDISGGSDGTIDPGMSKAAALRLYERKATRAYQAGKSAAVRFETDELTPAEMSVITDALRHADSLSAVKAVFDNFGHGLLNTASEAEALYQARLRKISG